MNEKIFVMGILLSPAILAIFILVVAGFAANSTETLAGWGILAGVLFVLQFLFLGKVAAWGGNSGPNPVFGKILIGSVISLVAYWLLGNYRLKGRK